MSNDKWSEWKPWDGGECPIIDNTYHVIKLRSGENIEDYTPQTWRWNHRGCASDIIAYRYKIKEPETTFMHEDLYWLATNVTEWDEEGSDSCGKFTHIRRDTAPDGRGFAAFGFGHTRQHEWFSKAQWIQARKDLGRIMSDEEEEAWQAKEREQSTKQLRYQDARGEDWIDEFARTKSVDEFRGAMSFNIGKYNRRAGKKDDINKELDKIIDYCQRWKAYELGLKG